MAGISRLVMEFLVGDLASGSLRRIAAGVKDMGEAGKNAAKHLELAGESLNKAIKAGSAARAIAEGLSPAVQAAQDMEASLKRVQAALSVDEAKNFTKELERARTLADRLQIPTPFSSEQIVNEAIVGLKKAGFSFNDILAEGGGAKASAYLATAEETSVESANDVIITLASKFSLAGDQLFVAADELARYSAAANTSATELGEALGQVSGAQEMGLTRDDVLGLLSVEANRGLRGSSGGTAVNAFIRQLAKLEENSGGKLSAFDASGAPKALADITTELRTTFGGMTTEGQQTKAQAWFGDEGKDALFALLNTGRGSMEEVLAGARDSQSLDSRVEIMASGLGAQKEALGGNVSTMLARLFEPALEPLKALVGKANAAVGHIGEAAAADPRLGKAATGGAAALIAGLGLYGGVQAGRAGLEGWRGMKALKNLPGAGLAGGVGTGKALEEIAGVTPVFVVNMPADGIGKGLSDAAGEAAGGAGRWAKGAQTALAVSGAGAVGWEVGKTIDSALIGEGTKTERIVNAFVSTQLPALLAAVATDGTEGLGNNAAAFLDGWRAVKEGLMEAVGVEVNVQVDAAGNATTVSKQGSGRRGGS